MDIYLLEECRIEWLPAHCSLGIPANENGIQLSTYDSGTLSDRFPSIRLTETLNKKLGETPFRE